MTYNRKLSSLRNFFLSINHERFVKICNIILFSFGVIFGTILRMDYFGGWSLANNLDTLVFKNSVLYSLHPFRVLWILLRVTIMILSFSFAIIFYYQMKRDWINSIINILSFFIVSLLMSIFIIIFRHIKIDASTLFTYIGIFLVIIIAIFNHYFPFTSLFNKTKT
ncbi:MAG: hypothetical protein K9W45_03575 [Candidatus Heimdallarchaeum aukensis]|uniref:Uncharacterized protein n=1 Tax=Candidatus Heimdallarchaeum aukensis TaxID=2876573 RepID=A0A9Y1BMK8_9ARCH|nr:MAG: hypothetical protein K9W45_03575 [Candidatus Heimdallarchaeum aukensis]